MENEADTKTRTGTGEGAKKVESKESEEGSSVYELVLKGYDGGTDTTDHLIKWVRARSAEDLKRWMAAGGIEGIVTYWTKIYSGAIAGVDVDITRDSSEYSEEWGHIQDQWMQEVYRATAGSTDSTGPEVVTDSTGPEVTMVLDLYHGRDNPHAELKDWGFTGPKIRGVVAFVDTYGHRRLQFKDAASVRAASEATGWRLEGGESGENASLELDMEFDEDMVKTKDGWFGDYSLGVEK